MTRAYVDANVVLRFLTGEPREMAENARALFEAAERGEIILVLDEIVVAEVVWVLSSFYGIDKGRISEVLRTFIANDGIEVEDKSGILLALTLFADMNVDFADALISVHMNRQTVTSIFTFDRHFDRLPGVKRLTPGARLAASDGSLDSG